MTDMQAGGSLRPAALIVSVGATFPEKLRKQERLVPVLRGVLPRVCIALT
jgi:hypothetical protein